MLFRQLFLEGCAPKPIEEENAYKSSEDSPSREEHKSRKKKRIGIYKTYILAMAITFFELACTFEIFNIAL